jgi:hypothetical protein
LPNRFSIVINIDFRSILNRLIEFIEWDFIVLYAHLLETVIILIFLFFSVNDELSRPADLE